MRGTKVAGCARGNDRTERVDRKCTGPHGEGDAKAWSEIEAALAKLYKLKAFRQKVTAAEGSVTMAVVPSNKIHTTISSQGGETMETIVVGSETRVRQGGGRWNCMPPGVKVTQMGPSVQQPEPRKMSGEVTATRGSVVAIDGVSTQSYSYTLTSRGSATTHRIYIGVANGLPGGCRSWMPAVGSALRSTTRLRRPNHHRPPCVRIV
jgi:hypothetical protein